MDGSQLDEDLFGDLGIAVEYKGVRTLDTLKKDTTSSAPKTTNVSKGSGNIGWDDDDLDVPLD